ncbi:pyridoxamine 5'-phosphate oxidase family protein [Nonomuraea rubra]|uniref:pyridoxamine 5'-phosphate oxidase family protein n=1 Tax=Nonomuraea rubra TaxID=46180 RepID=UPI00361FFA51
MKLDSAGLQVLTHEECMRLLPSRPIGRIVFTDRALPAVQPVNFCLDDQDIVIRTAAGSNAQAAGQPCCAIHTGPAPGAGFARWGAAFDSAARPASRRRCRSPRATG